MKQFLLLFALMFTTPLLASGIDAGATSATCDNATLETYNGTANVEIDWQPNEIQLRWYNGNTLIDTTNTNADSCVYDDVLNVPPTPTNRTGYTFTGWTLRPEMDFGTIDVNEMGISRYSKDVHNNADFCWRYINENSQYPACNSDDNFRELQQHEWKVLFTHGTLYGMAGCSTEVGTQNTSGNPIINSGSNCWCKATGYRATNASIINASNAILPWVYTFNYGESGTCAANCARNCSTLTSSTAGFRRSLYTTIGN